MKSKTITIKIPFYDVDPMNIVWHGHYIKYMERARTELLEENGIGYEQIFNMGYSFPVVDMRVKYIKPCAFNQTVSVTATIEACEFCLDINYLIRDTATGEKLCKGWTRHMAVNAATKESEFSLPAALVQKLIALFLFVLCATGTAAALPQSDLTSISGTFTQTKYFADADISVPSSGTFRAKKGEGIEWSIDKPSKASLILSPLKSCQNFDGVWRTIANHKAVEHISDMFESSLYGELDKLKPYFDISYTSGGKWNVYMVKKTSSTFSGINKVVLSGRGDLVQTVEITEDNGDKTDISFSNLEKNVVQKISCP